MVKKVTDLSADSTFRVPAESDSNASDRKTEHHSGFMQKKRKRVTEGNGEGVDCLKSSNFLVPRKVSPDQNLFTVDRPSSKQTNFVLEPPSIDEDKSVIRNKMSTHKHKVLGRKFTSRHYLLGDSFHINLIDPFTSKSFSEISRKKLDIGRPYIFGAIEAKEAGDRMTKKVIFFDAERMFSYSKHDHNVEGKVFTISGKEIAVQDVAFFYHSGKNSKCHLLGNIPATVADDDFNIIREFIDCTDDRCEDNVQSRVGIMMAVCLKHGIGFIEDEQMATSVAKRIDARKSHFIVSEILTESVEMSDVSFLQSLLEEGADPNAIRHDDGMSSLMLATHYGNEEAVRLLMRYGAKTDLSTCRGTVDDISKDISVPTMREALDQKPDSALIASARQKKGGELTKIIRGY